MYRGESCNIAGFSEVLSPEVLMGRSQSNTGSSMCIRIPNISDMYILQSTVTGTISLSKNPFIERIVDGLTHGKDIETVAKTLVWDAKQQGSKKFHVNKEKHGSEKSEERNGEPKQTFLIPERKSTLESAFRVTVQSFESE